MNEHTPFVVYLASNIWWLLGSFVFFLILLDIILVRTLKLGKVAWKRIDYIWLAFAILGLLSTSSDARRLYATNILERTKALAETDYKRFHYEVESGTRIGLCAPANRGEFSPKNFDQIEKDRSDACQYFKSLISAIPSDVKPNYQPIALPANPIKPNVSDELVAEYFLNVDKSLEDYNQTQKEVEEIKQLQARTGLEMTVAFLGPILLAFALALRFTKVPGEVKLEIRSKNNN